jgi:hypothetical protein
MKDQEPKLLYGKYKGYEVGYTQGGQMFPRAGYYLSKITKSGTVKDILYLEEALPKAIKKSK